MKKYKPTHKLKKEFVYSKDEKYPIGTPIMIPPRKVRNSFGFGGNAFFLGKNGTLAENEHGALAAFSLSFFKPQKDWFEKI